MSKKPVRPCIRGLECFRKTGCPQSYWTPATPEGCPAWKEYTVPTDGGKPIMIKDCIDMLSEHWQFEALKLLEGNQQATESFRNGMCEVSPDGKVVPKSPFATVALLNVFNGLNSNTKLIQ